MFLSSRERHSDANDTFPTKVSLIYFQMDSPL